MFPSFKVAFREQLMQKDLSVLQCIGDAATGARAAGTTCKPSWTTTCHVPSPAFFGQHEWFCVGPLAMGSLEADVVAGGRIWDREQGRALLTEACSLPSLTGESRGDSWLLQPIPSWKKSYHHT